MKDSLIQIKTTMRIDEKKGGESVITFTISGFPNRLIAGLYAAELLAMRDIKMHDELGEYTAKTDKETIH